MLSAMEQIGVLYIENQRLLGEYRNLLVLVQRAKNGEVQLSQIEVDLAEVKWAIIPLAVYMPDSATDQKVDETGP